MDDSSLTIGFYQNEKDLSWFVPPDYKWLIAEIGIQSAKYGIKIYLDASARYDVHIFDYYSSKSYSNIIVIAMHEEDVTHFILKYPEMTVYDKFEAAFQKRTIVAGSNFDYKLCPMGVI